MRPCSSRPRRSRCNRAWARISDRSWLKSRRTEPQSAEQIGKLKRERHVYPAFAIVEKCLVRLPLRVADIVMVSPFEAIACNIARCLVLGVLDR